MTEAPAFDPGHPHAAAMAHLSAADARMAALIGRVGPCGLTAHAAAPLPPSTYFSGLVNAIASQQLSPKAADTIYARVVALASGESGELSIARLLALPETKLREA